MQMDRLITDLLSSAIMEMGQLHLDTQPIKLTALVEKVIHDYVPLAQRKEQVLHFRPQNEDIIEADEARMEQIVDNFGE